MNHRSILRWVAAVGVLGTVLTPALPTASALEGIIDLSVEIESIPDVVVAQPDAGAVYRVTVTNAELSLFSGAAVTGTLPDGFAFTGVEEGCTVSGRDVTCELTVAPGTSVVLYLEASVSQTPATYEFTVTVESTDVVEPVEHQDNNTASASTTVVAGVDLGVDVESIPDVVVAQPDAGTIYRITVSNAAFSASGGSKVTGILPAGFALTGGDARCSASGSDVTCNLTVAPGTSVVLDLQASVSQVVGDYDFEVTVESTEVTEPPQFLGNNAATTWTSVVTADDGGGHPAYVCPGCSITFSDPEVGSAELFMPADSNGAIVRLSKDDSLANTSCGEVNGKPATCQIGLNVWFDEEEDDYQVDDESDPIQVHYTPLQQPCHGLGKADCAPIGYYDPAKDVDGPEGDPKPMPRCDGAGNGDNPGANEALVGGLYHVCTDQSYKDASGKVRHVVLMKSKDPIIPPLYL